MFRHVNDVYELLCYVCDSSGFRYGQRPETSNEIWNQQWAMRYDYESSMIISIL